MRGQTDTKPKITVAIITYNRSNLMRESLQSVLVQTYRDMKIVVIDDCSTDFTWEYIQQYEKNDNRIHCYRNEKNLGFVKNFEKSIMLCRGEYIALSDQDDIWSLDHLEILYKNINDAILISSNAILLDNSNTLGRTMYDTLGLSNLNMNEHNAFFFILYNNFVQGAACLFKKELLKYAYPFPDIIDFHDHWLALNAIMMGKINYLNEVTLNYRQHSKSITKKKDKTYISLMKNKKTPKRYDVLLLLQKKYSLIKGSKKKMLKEALRFYKSREKSFFPLYASIFLIVHYKKIYCQSNYKFLISRLLKMLFRIF